mgnify:CR=1 FL=1
MTIFGHLLVLYIDGLNVATGPFHRCDDRHLIESNLATTCSGIFTSG